MIALIAHLALGFVVLVVIRLTEYAFHYLWGTDDPMLWDRIPVRYFFHAADAGVLIVFIFYGTYEAFQKLRGK
jgi:hypothetical protein